MADLATNDHLIARGLAIGALRVEPSSGNIYCPNANNPTKPAGHRTAKGYLRVGVTIDGQRVGVMAHRVVWIAVHGVPANAADEVDHINLIKTDNRIDNLELVSQRENTDRAVTHGRFRHPTGAESPRAKLTEADVCALRSGEVAYTDLAARHGMNPFYVHAVLRGVYWTHLPPASVAIPALSHTRTAA